MTIVRLDSPSKYRNKRTNGFASAAEARRGAELELLERAGKIRDLQRQVPYTLLPADPELGYSRPLIYLLDFQYFDVERNCIVREEVKGVWTRAAKMKIRLMEQHLGIGVTIVK